MLRIRCLDSDHEPLRLLSEPPLDRARSTAALGRRRLSVPGWPRVAAWWASRRAARREGVAQEIEALRGRVETLENSLLGIVRAVQEGLDLAAERSAPPAPACAPVPPVAEVAPAETRPITPAEMWALTPEMWGDTVETWAETTMEERPETAPAVPSGMPAAAPPDCPATADGRALSDIRPAALRLAREGWPAETIAEKLRLGVGDVHLILKSEYLRPKTGHAELAHTRR